MERATGTGERTIEVSLVNAMSRELILRSMVDRLREFYDYIIIDCITWISMKSIA